jgi:hypothetical protein
LLLGVLILTQNRLSFMPLGFVGPSYSQDLEDAPDNTSAAAALCVGVEKQGLGLGLGLRQEGGNKHEYSTVTGDEQQGLQLGSRDQDDSTRTGMM